MASATSKGWSKKWEVPGSNGKTWTVAVRESGEYGCSCPVWKFRRQECHHIKLVKQGGGAPLERMARPQYVLAKVNKPTYKPPTNELYIPLIEPGDPLLMEATICFYLLKYGYSMGEIREIRRHIPSSWTVRAIIAHVETHGEAEYPDGWYRT
jgi:hypothetical protein